jgi:hypothetical protein
MSTQVSLRARLAVLVVALWAGALWAACVLVPAASFTSLADPSLAGKVAGRSFLIVSIAGAVFAVLALALSWTWQTRIWLGMAVACAVLPAASELFIGPAMRAARLAGDAAGARLYHGAASAMFMSAAILALVLLWRSTRSAISPPRAG